MIEFLNGESRFHLVHHNLFHLDRTDFANAEEPAEEVEIRILVEDG